jgi:hypothetical protein
VLRHCDDITITMSRSLVASLGSAFVAAALVLQGQHSVAAEVVAAAAVLHGKPLAVAVHLEKLENRHSACLQAHTAGESVVEGLQLQQVWRHASMAVAAHGRWRFQQGLLKKEAAAAAAAAVVGDQQVAAHTRFLTRSDLQRAR